jgi:tetratricopeptide (TPR) repeat protein
MLMMKKIVFVGILFAVLPFFCQAQLGGLKDKLVKKVKEASKDRANNEIDSGRDRLDSTDFNYAIVVIDNSGMLNVKDLNERATKTLSAVKSFKTDESKKSAAQKSRDLLDIAEKFYEERRFKEAEPFFLSAKLSYETEGITDNINYSKVHADLGLLYATMGRYNTAEFYSSEALSIREQTLGRNSKAGASSLNNMAVLYQETARFNESEKYFDEALQVVKDQLGVESQEYATVLNNQAILFSEIGRIDQAVSKLNEAIVILEKLNKKGQRDQVGLQSNLALLYQQTGKFKEAEAVYLKLERELGNKNPYYAGVLNNLALLYIQMNQLDKVEGYLNKARDIYKERFGAENPNYAKVLNDLGNFYRMQGKFTEAEQNLTEALRIRGVALDTNHPDYVKSQEDLAILYWKKGDLAKADASYTIAMDKSLDFINRYFPPMSEAEKTKYWDVLQPRFQRYYNYCLEASTTNPAIINTMFDYQAATKGLLLNSTNKIKKAILGSGNNELIKNYVAWLDKKETLARLYSLSKEELKEQKIDLASLEKEANDMERALSQQSGDFSKRLALLK